MVKMKRRRCQELISFCLAILLLVISCSGSSAQHMDASAQQMSGPSSQQMGETSSQQMSGPSSQQMGETSSQQMSGPSSQQMSGPPAQQMSETSSQQMSGPSAQQMSGPSAQQMSGPSAQQMSGPSSQQMSGPSSQQMSGPSSQQMSGPSSQQMSGPSSQQVGGPSLQQMGETSLQQMGGAKSSVGGSNGDNPADTHAITNGADDGTADVMVRNWRGIATKGDESYPIRLNVETIWTVDPDEARNLLASNMSLEDVRSRLRAGKRDEILRGDIRLNNDSYRLIDIILASSGNKSTLKASLASPSSRSGSGEAASVVGHTVVTISVVDEIQVAEGYVVITDSKYIGTYSLLLE